MHGRPAWPSRRPLGEPRAGGELPSLAADLTVRDLTDPAQGHHAIQLLVNAAVVPVETPWERLSPAAVARLGIGMCGLHHQESYPDDVEVAWRLAREHGGQGCATEAATGWLDHAFGALNLPRVISITDPCAVWR